MDFSEHLSKNLCSPLRWERRRRFVVKLLLVEGGEIRFGGGTEEDGHGGSITATCWVLYNLLQRNDAETKTGTPQSGIQAGID